MPRDILTLVLLNSVFEKPNSDLGFYRKVGLPMTEVSRLKITLEPVHIVETELALVATYLAAGIIRPEKIEVGDYRHLLRFNSSRGSHTVRFSYASMLQAVEQGATRTSDLRRSLQFILDVEHPTLTSVLSLMVTLYTQKAQLFEGDRNSQAVTILLEGALLRALACYRGRLEPLVVDCPVNLDQICRHYHSSATDLSPYFNGVKLTQGLQSWINQHVLN